MTLKDYAFCAAAWMGVAAQVGCGSSPAGNSPNDGGKHEGGHHMTIDAGHDGGADAPSDSGTGEAEASVDTGPKLNHGMPSMTYPAFTPFMAQLINNGGPVLSAPQIVTISWTSDPNYPTWESFDDQIGSTSYWSTTTSEYGVGAATSGGHVELSTTAPTWADSDVDTFVSTNASDTASSGWPAPTANTLYTIFLPPSTSAGFTVQGMAACGGGYIIGGYHANTSTTGGQSVSYAVVIQCPGTRVDDNTASASHELIEAATDAQPFGIPAWIGMDDSKYLSWDLLQQFQDEVGDMCEMYQDSYYTDPTLGHGVQRTWSNMSGAAGHAPCVPAESGPYFNVTPLMQESITINLGMFGGSPATPGTGYYIPVGTSKTFAVGFYSDSATGGPWTISAQPDDSGLTATIDVTDGQNGNMAYVTATVHSTDSSKAHLLVIQSQLGSYPPHFMPILISSQ